MRWSTRAGVHIDRAASAWLIRSYIDPDAEFVPAYGDFGSSQDSAPSRRTRSS